MENFCPIRAELVANLFARDELRRDGLYVMAALRLAAVGISPPLQDRLWSLQYPLRIIQSVLQTKDESHIAELRGLGRLPWVDLRTVSRVVSARWDRGDVRAHYPYWIDLWNSNWNDYGTFGLLPTHIQEKILRIIDRLRQHPEVTSVGVNDSSLDLAPIDWKWQEDLRVLSLRGILAYALINAMRFWDVFAAELRSENETKFLGSLHKCLRAVFKLAIETNFSPSVVAEMQLHEIRQELPRRAAIPLLPIVSAIDCAKEIAAYLAAPSEARLNTITYTVSQSGAICPSIDHYLALIALELGDFPNLGDPIPVDFIRRFTAGLTSIQL